MSCQAWTRWSHRRCIQAYLASEKPTEIDTADLIARVQRFASDSDNPDFASAVTQISRLDADPQREASVVRPHDSILEALSTVSTASASAASLLSAVRSSIECLRWYPAPATMPGHLLDRMAAAEILGPDGDRHSDSYRLGIFVMAPDTDFPQHRHSASEFYAVVAGTAQWLVEDRPATLAPMNVIEVPGRSWHAIRTGQAPMLCCYLWQGLVGFDDYEFEPLEAGDT